MQKLLYLFTGSGLFLALISLPLIGEKIPPNLYYGFRLEHTLEDEHLWYSINQFSGKRIFFTSITLVLAAILFYQVPGMSVGIYAWICLAVFVLSFGMGIVQSYHYMKSLQEQ